MLRSSAGILSKFAAMDGDRNHTYELNFGLLDYEPDGAPFVVTEDEAGILHLGLSRTIEDRTKFEISRRLFNNDLKPQLPHNKCPALGPVLTAQWNRAIDMCLEDPEIFAAELGLLPTAPAEMRV